MSSFEAVAKGVILGAVAGAEGLAHGVSLKTHRSDTHGSIELHPALDMYARFRLWTTTGQKRREWVAVHRKHHRFSDVEGDPHSPVIESQNGTRNGVRRVKWLTAKMYRDTINNNPDLIKEYAPEMAQPDKLDEKIFDQGTVGVGVVQPLALAGILHKSGLRGSNIVVATAIATATSLFVALRAGGEVNSTSHTAETRSSETHDHSSNLGEGMPGIRGVYTRAVGSISTGGEAIGHENHHRSPWSAIFHETLDPVGIEIGFLSRVGLVKINHVDERVDSKGKYPRATGQELERLQSITPQHVLAV